MTQEGKAEACEVKKDFFVWWKSVYLIVLCLLMVVKPGELFTQEEMDEMLTALADNEKNLIYYKDLISQLTIDPDM